MRGRGDFAVGRAATSTLRVPFLDLKRVNDRDAKALNAAVQDVIRSGHYLFGPQLAGFESEYAAYCGTQWCVGLANGLDALRLTLQAWVSLGRLERGDEVVVPANSFVASALAVEQAGLAVRFADVARDSFNVSVESVDAAITARTRVVMAVHLYGQLAVTAQLRALCKRRGLLLLEDAAQAQGALLANERAGALGDAAAFSFYPTKNLGALGDAGCVVTSDAALAERVRAIGNYGSASKYDHRWPGINSRLDEVQAALLRIKLARLDEDNHARRRIAARYHEGIRHDAVSLPAPPSAGGAHVWHIYAVRARQRDRLVEHLAARGVETLVHYPCIIPRQPLYAGRYATEAFPVAEALQQEVLSLPISPVMDDASVDYVIDAINAWRCSGRNA